MTTLDNFMLEWTAKYYTFINVRKDLIANDFSTVRVFTLNEIQLFLYLNNFEIFKTIDRKPMLTTPMSLLQKSDSKLFNSKSLLFQSKYCKATAII
jgi:hypothetical protein